MPVEGSLQASRKDPVATMNPDQTRLPPKGPGFNEGPCGCVCESCRSFSHRGCPGKCTFDPAPYTDEELLTLEQESRSLYDGRFSPHVVARLKATVAQHKHARSLN